MLNAANVEKMFNKIKVKYSVMPREIKASFWFLICAFLQRGISFITTPIFTRLMTTSEYGEFSVFYSWFGIISIITTLNLFFGVYVRGLVIYEEDKNRFTSSMQGLMLTLVIVWTCFYLLFHRYFNNLLHLTTFQMLCMLIVIWTNGVFSFWAAEQRVDLEYRRLAIVSIITSILLPVVQMVLMFTFDDKVNARIIGMALVNVAFYPLLFAKHMLRGHCFFSWEIWKYALTFNIPLIPHYLSQTVLNSADRIMIERMIGTSQAGIYSLAYSISQIMTVFNSAMMQTIEPWLYKKIKNNEASSIKKVAYPAFAVIAIVNLGLIALAPELVAFFAPGEYAEAIWVIPPVAMSVFFSFLYTFFAVFEFYYKKTQYITIATLIGAVLNIILNFIFLKIYGYYAAGYTTLVCFIFYAVFHYLFMRILINKNLENEKVYDVRIILLMSFVFIIAGFALLFTYELPLVRYVSVLAFIGTILVRHKMIIRHIKVIQSERKG